MEKLSETIDRILFQIKEGIDSARSNGVECDYPRVVVIEHDGEKLSVVFPYRIPPEL